MPEVTLVPKIKMFTVRHGKLIRKEAESNAIVIRTTIDVPRELWKQSGKFVNLYSIHTHPTLDLEKINDYESFINNEGFKMQGFNEKEFELYAKPLITKLYPEAVDAIRTERYSACLNRAAWVAWWKTEGAYESDKTTDDPIDVEITVSVEKQA